MIFLQEYLILRTELGRELTHLELDRNFLFVSNPWNENRSYTEGMVVYYGDETTAGVGPLSWYRANQDINPESVFDFSKWDPIGQSAASGNIIVKDSLANFNSVSTIEFSDDFTISFPGSTALITLSPGSNIWQPTIGDPNTIYYNNPVLIGSTTVINSLYKLTVAGHELITGNLQVNGTINSINLTTFFNNFNTHSHTIVPNTLPGYSILYPNSKGQLSDTDINIGTLATGHVLSWDNTTKKWINSTITTSSHSLGTHTDVAPSVSITPLNNQILRYNSGTAKWENITIVTDNNTGFSTAPFLHNHDNRYYTKSQLINVTGALINWANIFGTPTFPSAAESYVVMSASGNLTNERILTQGSGIIITDGGANSPVTISVLANSSNQLINLQKNGTSIGVRPTLNFIEPVGGLVSITAVDNIGNDRIDITLNTSFSSIVTSVNGFIGDVDLAISDLVDVVISPQLFPGPGSGTPYSPDTNILVFDDDIDKWTNIPINVLIAEISGLYLDDLLDVTIPLTGLADKDILYFDDTTSQWISGAANDANIYTISNLQGGSLNTIYYTKTELLTNTVSPKIHWNKIFGVPSFAPVNHSHYLFQIIDVQPYSTPSLNDGDILVWDTVFQLWTPTSFAPSSGGNIISNSTIPGTFVNTTNQLLVPTSIKPIRFEAGDGIQIDTDTTEHIIRTSVLVDNITIGINTAGEIESLAGPSATYPFFDVSPLETIVVEPRQEYTIVGDLEIEAGTTFTNQGKVVIINGALIENGVMNNTGQIIFYDFAEVANTLSLADALYHHIISSATITIKNKREYFVYGDLKVDGILNIEAGGKLVIMAGSLDLTGGGTVNNDGDIIFVPLPTLQSVTNSGNTTTNDIIITDPTKGIILTSPDLTQWRITVDNTGTLTTTSI